MHKPFLISEVFAISKKYVQIYVFTGTATTSNISIVEYSFQENSDTTF